jgi:hypothetical protein
MYFDWRIYFSYSLSYLFHQQFRRTGLEPKRKKKFLCNINIRRTKNVIDLLIKVDFIDEGEVIQCLLSVKCLFFDWIFAMILDEMQSIKIDI